VARGGGRRGVGQTKGGAPLGAGSGSHARARGGRRGLGKPRAALLLYTRGDGAAGARTPSRPAGERAALGGRAGGREGGARRAPAQCTRSPPEPPARRSGEWGVVAVREGPGAPRERGAGGRGARAPRPACAPNAAGRLRGCGFEAMSPSAAPRARVPGRGRWVLRGACRIGWSANAGSRVARPLGPAGCSEAPEGAAAVWVRGARARALSQGPGGRTQMGAATAGRRAPAKRPLGAARVQRRGRGARVQSRGPGLGGKGGGRGGRAAARHHQRSSARRADGPAAIDESAAPGQPAPAESHLPRLLGGRRAEAREVLPAKGAGGGAHGVAAAQLPRAAGCMAG
jgi:hypothetical protein